MKKILILTIISLMAFTTFAQKPHAFFINQEGDTVKMYSDYTYKGNEYILWTKYGEFNYKDENGKKQSYKEKEIKVLVNGMSLYIPLKSSNKKKAGKRLMKILAYNDKYILAGIISGMDRIYVFDRDFNIVEEYLFFAMANRIQRKNSAKKIEEHITKYFKNCPYVTENFLKNIDGTSYKASASGNKHGYLDNGFDSYQCGDAEPIIFYNLLNEGGIRIRKDY